MLLRRPHWRYASLAVLMAVELWIGKEGVQVMTHGYGDASMWKDIIFFAVVFIPAGVAIGWWVWG